MLLRIHPEMPSAMQIHKVVDALKNDGIIIYPTDSVYAIGCDIFNKKAVEKLARFKGIKVEKANFTFVFNDLSDLSEYAKIDNKVFKIIKKNIPGPFTFILDATRKVPKLFENKKRTIGIRVPDNNIPREIVKTLGNPIITTSLHDEDEIIEYTTDPELIYDKYKNMVDIIINGGYGNNIPSTVVDCTGDDIDIVREGMGELSL